MKLFLAPLIAVLGATFGTASLAPAEVLIGLATPLSGHMAWAGASDQVGAESAVADLKAKGGVLGELTSVLVAINVAAGLVTVAGVVVLLAIPAARERPAPRGRTPARGRRRRAASRR